LFTSVIGRLNSNLDICSVLLKKNLIGPNTLSKRLQRVPTSHSPKSTNGVGIRNVKYMERSLPSACFAMKASWMLKIINELSISLPVKKRRLIPSKILIRVAAVREVFSRRDQKLDAKCAEIIEKLQA